MDISIDGLKNVITENKNLLLGGAAGVAVGGLATAGIIASTNSKNKKKSSKKRKSKGSRDRIFKSKQKHERRYKRKRKYKVYGKKGWINPKKKKSKSSRSKKGVHYTKNGQPYILLRSGKARFIKRRK